ncbi:MAG: YraN family protein [Burkholderiales bacterium]|nr:YraN family protein [Burkholderiales bacterium]
MKTKGDAAERVAEAYLVKQGLKVVARNWRCRHGELDLICRDGAALVFVEVRSRASSQFGGAADSITPHKQARLIAAAQLYLSGLGRVPPCRFDAVLLEGDAPPRWLKNIIEL